MTTPEWLKPGLYGALAGAALVAIGGFSLGGWVTEGGADKMASAMAHDDVIAALIPVCLDMSRSDADRLAKLEVIRGAATFKRREAVMEAGWATMPGTETPNRDLAQACIAALELDAS